MAEINFPQVQFPQVDTSSYGAPARGAQGNPFGIMQDMVGMQQTMMQNRLMQQEFVAKKAMGEIIQQTIDPESGQPNWNKAGIMLSIDPRTAFMAPKFLQDLQQRQLIDRQIFGAEVKNAQDTFNLIANLSTPIFQEWANSDSGKQGLAPPDPTDPTKADIKPLIDAVSTLTAQNPALGQTALDTLIGVRMGSRKEAFERLGGIVKSAQVAQKGLDGVTTALELELVDPITGKPDKVFGTVDRFKREFRPYSSAPSGVPGMSVVDAPAEEGADGTRTAPTQPEPLRVQTGLDPIRAEGIKKFAMEYVPELQDRVQQANQLDLLMSQAKDYLKDFTPGGGMQLRADLASLAQAVGVPEEEVDKIVGASGGGFGSVQAAQKILFGVGSSIAAQLVRAGGGRMTQTEWAQTLMRGAPNIDLDPRAIKKILESMKEVTHFTRMEGDLYQRFSARPNADPLQWRSTWNELFSEMLKAREERRTKKSGR